MIIDCDGCTARGLACGDCVVTVLLGGLPTTDAVMATDGIELDEAERRAVTVLVRAGLVPSLRHLNSYTVSQHTIAQSGKMVG